jgi:hypothetical protein
VAGPWTPPNICQRPPPQNQVPHQVVCVCEVRVWVSLAKVRQWHTIVDGLGLGPQLIHKDGLGVGTCRTGRGGYMGVGVGVRGWGAGQCAAYCGLLQLGQLRFRQESITVGHAGSPTKQ